MIKAVLMDIDNTLLDFNECAKYAMRCSFGERGLEYTERVAQTFFKINTMLWNDIEKGILDKEGLYKVRWKYIFRELGINTDGEEFEKYFLKYLSRSFSTVEGAHDILKYLSGKYLLSAASNGPQFEQDNRLKNAGIYDYFQSVFTSEAVGYPKPKKEFFMICLEKMGNLLPSETIMVGDSLNADIVGAKNCGIVTCWFDYEQINCPPPSCADYTVNSLAQLTSFL